MVIVRNATENDAQQIVDIYAYYVANSLATLDNKAFAVSDILDNIKNRDVPFLVAFEDDKVIGYAYAFSYRKREGYKYTLEESIYVKDGHHGKGVGKKLLDCLIMKLKELNYKQLLAVITLKSGSDESEAPSILLHKACGFRKVGQLVNVGYKFDEWIDTVLMQRSI
jgi:L-amino acid N-acyltransferase YncA